MLKTHGNSGKIGRNPQQLMKFDGKTGQSEYKIIKIGLKNTKVDQKWCNFLRKLPEFSQKGWKYPIQIKICPKKVSF